MAVVSMKQLLEAGVHFGHQTRRWNPRSEEHTSELQSHHDLVCRLLLEKKNHLLLLLSFPLFLLFSFPLHSSSLFSFLFFFNDTATTEIYTLSLHDALPILIKSAL